MRIIPSYDAEQNLYTIEIVNGLKSLTLACGDAYEAARMAADFANVLDADYDEYCTGIW